MQTGSSPSARLLHLLRQRSGPRPAILLLPRQKAALLGARASTQLRHARSCPEGTYRRARLVPAVPRPAQV